MSGNGINVNNVDNNQQKITETQKNFICGTYTIKGDDERQVQIVKTNVNAMFVTPLVRSTSLASKYINFSRMIVKKTENSLWNSIKNTLIRGREASLEEIKTQLEGFEKGETFIKIPRPDTKGLSREVKNALKNLIKDISTFSKPSDTPNNTPPKEQKSYSREDFIKMFRKINKAQSIGAGGFGKVYRDKDFVFKVIKDKNMADLEIDANQHILEGKNGFKTNKEVLYKESEGFFTEYKTSFDLEDDGKVLVFEYVKGLDLHKYMYKEQEFANNESVSDIHKKKLKNSNVKFCTDCVIFSQMAMGIAALHETGCVNRDIKPENTMVCFRSETDSVEDSIFVKTIDQGFTADLKEGKDGFAFAGTYRFIPPECWKKNVKPIPAHDVYAFGVTLAENFTKNEFFVPLHVIRNKRYPRSDAKKIQGLQPNNIQDNVPNGAKNFICRLIKSCCAEKPEERITAAQASALLQILYSAVDANRNVQLKKGDFEEALKLVREARPKSIPLAMREMMQSDDSTVRQKGCEVILKLGNDDPSYQNTPSYGLALLRSGTNLGKWGKQYPWALGELNNRMFIPDKDAQVEKKIIEDTVHDRDKEGKLIKTTKHENTYEAFTRDISVTDSEKEAVEAVYKQLTSPST